MSNKNNKNCTALILHLFLNLSAGLASPVWGGGHVKSFLCLLPQVWVGLEQSFVPSEWREPIPPSHYPPSISYKNGWWESQKWGQKRKQHLFSRCEELTPNSFIRAFMNGCEYFIVFIDCKKYSYAVILPVITDQMHFCTGGSCLIWLAHKHLSWRIRIKPAGGLHHQGVRATRTESSDHVIIVLFELEAAGVRWLLDLLDRPFGGPVLLPSSGGRQVEGLGLAF